MHIILFNTKLQDNRSLIEHIHIYDLLLHKHYQQAFPELEFALETIKLLIAKLKLHDSTCRYLV